jgi:hypothetical protein
MVCVGSCCAATRHAHQHIGLLHIPQGTKGPRQMGTRLRVRASEEANKSEGKDGAESKGGSSIGCTKSCKVDSAKANRNKRMRSMQSRIADRLEQEGSKATRRGDGCVLCVPFFLLCFSTPLAQQGAN